MEKLKMVLKYGLKKIGLDLRRYNKSYDSSARIVGIINAEQIDLVYDIGANTGQFGAMLRANGYAKNIVSFEPLSSARKKLSKFCQKDPLWKLHPQAALGKINGFTEINISENSVSSSVLNILDLHIVSSGASRYISSENVPLVTLDSLCSEYLSSPAKLCLKIDTQGYEWEVLQGAVQTLKYVKVIICELSLAPLYENQADWIDIISWLGQLGFVLWSIDPGFSDSLSFRTLQLDAIFIRKG